MAHVKFDIDCDNEKIYKNIKDKCGYCINPSARGRSYETELYEFSDIAHVVLAVTDSKYARGGFVVGDENEISYAIEKLGLEKFVVEDKE